MSSIDADVLGNSVLLWQSFEEFPKFYLHIDSKKKYDHCWYHGISGVGGHSDSV